MEQPNGIITLTTDFGNRDPYAGIMKGIVLKANIAARIIDITHEVPAHNIIAGAFMLYRSFKHFPEGSVHVAVVDPGVGGRRKNIAVKTDRYFFIGPDNGILSVALTNERNVQVREIKNQPFVYGKISDTFHGRDVFAPCAGHLSAGADFETIGPELDHWKELNYPKARREGNVLVGEVVTSDSFGNLITNVSEHQLASFAGHGRTEIFFATERFEKVHQRYSDVPRKTALALISSCGFLEISINEGSAADYFMTAAGTPVTIRKY